jgi:transcription initiation factor TFIIB
MLGDIEVAERRSLLRLDRCPECESNEIVTDTSSGEVLCCRCGLVIRDSLLDQTPEWSAFTPEEWAVKVRAGPPTSLKQFDKGLSTTFKPCKDAFGRSLPLSERLKMMRLQKWNIQAQMHSSAERNLSQAMNELTLVTDKLHIPDSVEEYAALIYRRALDKGLIRGRSVPSIIVASLYAACRLTRTPRSLNEIVEASTRSLKEASRCYRLVQRKLDLTMPLDDPSKYVSKIASQSGLSQKTQNLAIELLQRVNAVRGDVGKAPAGIAAAALYLASIMNDEKITQKKLAEVAGVTDVTIRNRYKGLDRSLDLGMRTERR